MKSVMGRVFKLPLKKRTKRKNKGEAPHIDWSYLLDRFYDTHYNVSTNEDWWGKWMTDDMWASLNPYQPRHQGYFHPSAGLLPELGGCPREMMFDLLCAPRSQQNFRSSLGKRLDNGTNRHTGLHVAFMGMEAHSFMGIVSYTAEQRFVHPWLPIEGNGDGTVEMTTGWTYLLDYKTKADRPWKSCYEPETRHKAQVNTYLGCGGLPVGYILYENKNSQVMAGPMKRMRARFDPKMFDRTERFCLSILKRLAKGDFPEFNQATCDANILFCAYQQSCEAHREGTPISDLDRRSVDLEKRHLKVV